MLALPPINLAGCGGKLRASDTVRVAGKSGTSAPFHFLGLLAPDAGPLVGESSLVATVDVIRPVTRDTAVFTRTAIYHALNDLWACGSLPTDLCVAYGIDRSALEQDDLDVMADTVRTVAAEFDLGVANSHTYVSDSTTLGLTCIGRCTDISISPVRPGVEYSVIATKPLGAAIASYYGWLLDREDLWHSAHRTMLLHHHTIREEIAEFAMQGTTDVSGFGLAGHLAALCAFHQCECTLDGSAIRGAFDRHETFIGMHHCAAERNSMDFGELVVWDRPEDPLLELLLFEAEVSGPIACIVPSEASVAFVKLLVDRGFVDAAIIGTLKGGMVPKVVVS